MKTFTLLLVAFVFTGQAFASDSGPDIAATDTCKALHNPLPEAKHSTRSHHSQIDSWKSHLSPVLKLYRDAWQKICLKEEDASLSLIIDLYPKVLNSLTAAANAPNLAIPEDLAEDWNYKQTAADLPFFNATLKPGSTTTYDFNFDLKGFLAFSDKMGKKDDKIFGYVTKNVVGLESDPIWLLSAGGHRKSCVKFGEYNWYAAFEILKKAKKYFSTAYLAPMAKLRSDLVHVFDVGASKDICSCGDPSLAKTDFENLRVQAGTDPYYLDILEVIKAAQLKMGERDFHFGSYLGNSCAALGT